MQAMLMAEHNGLFAVGILAAANGDLLDPGCTTTCSLAISTDALTNHSDRVMDELQGLYPSELEIKPVGGVPAKIDEAWKKRHKLDTFLLHKDDCDLWQRKHPGFKHPRIVPVQTLAELYGGFLAKNQIEEELERCTSVLCYSDLCLLFFLVFAAKPRANFLCRVAWSADFNSHGAQHSSPEVLHASPTTVIVKPLARTEATSSRNWRSAMIRASKVCRIS